MPTFLALTSQGIEQLLAEELADFGAEDIKQSVNSVSFTANIQLSYRICLATRYASRILLKLNQGIADNAEQLYDLISETNWFDLIQPWQTFAVDFVGTNREIINSQFGALKVKDAIVDQFTRVTGDRPNIDKSNPDIVIQVRLRKQHAQVYLDFSGPSLHQRGYREKQGAAPLKENLAAAIIKRSGWLDDTSRPLYDPFCGSGTLLIEAALMANHIAPGLLRRSFAFMEHQDYQQADYDQARASLEEQMTWNNLTLVGRDNNRHLVRIAKENLSRATPEGAMSLKSQIRFDVGDATKGHPTFEQAGVIVCNPPYGERLGDLADTAVLYNKFSHRVKQEFEGWQLAFFTGVDSPLNQLKLARNKTYKFQNGPLDCQLVTYELTERQCQTDGGDGLSLNFEESVSFGNRLKKNIKATRQAAKKEGVDCYRIYDADIPEYNVAIDRYADHAVIFEYAAPKSVDESSARRRLADVLVIAAEVLDVPPGNIVMKVREKQRGEKQYEKLSAERQEFTVQEYQAKFLVNLKDYLDTGLFLDHRITRKLVGELAKDKQVLNLFAYTGTASVHAALGGARSVTTVDMSNTYLEWAQRNFAVNGLKGRQYQFFKADCMQWVRRCQQRYDLIFLDPPTFSNSKGMQKSFDVLRDHVELLRMVKSILAPGGTLIFSNNHRRFKIDAEALEALGLEVKDITAQTIPFDFKRNAKIHNCWQLTAN